MQLKMPEGQQAEKRVITLPLPGVEAVLRFIAHSSDLTTIASIRPTIHIDIVRHPAFIKYVRGLQNGVDEPVELSTHRTPVLPNEFKEAA
jgi:hypothetical protein